jgi:hypothetical protein
MSDSLRHFDSLPSDDLSRECPRRRTGVREVSCETGVESLACANARPLFGHDQLPVTRLYKPEPAALEDLVDVLYKLLVNVPADESTLEPAKSEATCFSIAPE